MSENTEAVLYSEVRQMLEAGLTPEGVAMELDIAVSSVYRIRKLLGMTAPKKDPFEGLDVATICKDYSDGMPHRDLVKKHGIDANKMYRVLSAENIPLRRYDPKRASAREMQVSDAIAMYVAGYKIREISVDTGVNQPVLHKELARRGISFRRNYEQRQKMGNKLGDASGPVPDPTETPLSPE